MRISIILVVLVSLPYLTFCQEVTNGLIAHYSFNNCENLGKDDSGNNTDALLQGEPECACGVEGEAILLDGIDDYLFFLGTISNVFNTIDFTISMYIKPNNPVGSQDILSKREACGIDRTFALRMTPDAKVEVLLSQDASRNTTISGQLPFEPCWFHIVFVRRGNRSLLFIDGVLVDQAIAESRVNIDNNAELNISNGECVGITDNRFAGLIDELRVYDRALRVEEVEALNLQPDRIQNEDAIIFLGSSVEVNLGNSCANRFLWTPTIGVNDPKIATPTITPPEAGMFTYQVSLSDQFCTATDTFQITVIDPEDLPCEAQLPSAFTPNGDGRNDTYGISNSVVLENKLILFEIFDRWGSRLFFTNDPIEQWNGQFDGQELNPGVLMYRVRYMCGEEEKVDMGSLTLLR